MGNKQPTPEQIVEFWEWCGVAKNESSVNRANGYPCYDSLDDLFKYAVPKLHEIGSGLDLCSYVGNQFSVACYSTNKQSGFMGKAIDKTPTLALFWAIWQVVQEVKDV